MNKFNLDILCVKDDLRPIMEYVLVGKEVCVATDAHVLGVVPTNSIFDEEFISGIPETPILIHREDWKKMMQYDVATWKVEGEVVKCLSSKKRDLLFEVDTQENVGKYPNWEGVIPKLEDRNVELIHIGINLELATKLQKAMGWTSTWIQFTGVNKAVYCRSVKEDERKSGAYGIVMPVLIS